jgi:hypothetical protein
MNKFKLGLGSLAVLGLAVLAAPASAAVDWAGTWTGSIDTRDMGVDTITLVLNKADKTYTGMIEDTLGLIDKNTPITEVKLDGAEIQFSFKAVGGSMDFAMKIAANGDTISAQLMNKAIGEWGPFESIAKK